MAEEPSSPVNRLCSEIQLFDLCERVSCEFKHDRFCTNDLLLKKFEAIREEDDRQTLLYDENEFDEDDESDFTDIDDELDEEPP